MYVIVFGRVISKVYAIPVLPDPLLLKEEKLSRVAALTEVKDIPSEQHERGNIPLEFVFEPSVY